MNFIHRLARALLDAMHACQLDHKLQKFHSFTFFFETNIQQANLLSHSAMSLFISTGHYFDYDVRDRPKKWETKNEMREKRFLLEADR